MARIGDGMVEALNEQLGRELEASQQYLAMAVYLDDLSLQNLAGFYYRQAEEERGHAMKIVRYLGEAGKRAVVPQLPAPKAVFESPKEVAEVSLAQERGVTDAVHALVDRALEDKDHATFHFLQWFVDEQVEEEDIFGKLVDIMNAARDMLQVEAYVRHMGGE
jgi:ferritin